jgi:hypothetical protein
VDCCCADCGLCVCVCMVGIAGLAVHVWWAWAILSGGERREQGGVTPCYVAGGGSQVVILVCGSINQKGLCEAEVPAGIFLFII